jgi:hypothetical protein
MRTILGIDAAWTGNEPSGVALVIERAGTWQCVAVAPSYSDFLGQSESKPTNWMADSFLEHSPTYRFFFAQPSASRADRWTW